MDWDNVTERVSLSTEILNCTGIFATVQENCSLPENTTLIGNQVCCLRILYQVMFCVKRLGLYTILIQYPHKFTILYWLCICNFSGCDNPFFEQLKLDSYRFVM